MCCNPDVSKIQRNTTASQNGNMIEELARKMFPGLNFLNGQFDAELEGRFLEVKSCQAHIVDNSHPISHMRTGRFVFTAEQHQALLEQNGEYLFIVHVNGNPLITFKTPASSVSLSSFSGNKSVVWRKIAKQFLGVA
ncbi:hypothetical protein [Methanosarcina sp.]|uniref:hypothetical protein n=1 Tax=Methanosarcina sp. TaxID=2213 RepID=UPI003BB6353E